MPSIIKQLASHGQSLWYDNIQRRLLENGGLAKLIKRGEIRGVTSNPTIFLNAIAKSTDYDTALIAMAWSGWDAERIFWQLAVEDIRAAADLFLPLYHATAGADGYVSLEVNPLLAEDVHATVEQVKYLWQVVDHPNLMIKIPATQAGLLAIRQAIAAGINVNVTLIFSIARYQEVIDAYLAGLEDRILAKQPVADIASVASFFVSRLDTKVDALLPEDSPLRGKAAIANTKLAYAEFRKVFGGTRFAPFQLAGCRIQRPLWASTSTKNPAYPDTIYVDNLIGPATVNTMPPQTLDAFRDHGKVTDSLLQNVDEARVNIDSIEQMGISMARVTQELEIEGVQAFAQAYAALLETIESRRVDCLAQLGNLQEGVRHRIAHLVAASVPSRIGHRDPALWSSIPREQQEIRHRLGWLDLPQNSLGVVEEIRLFVESVRAENIDHFLLLGMGGSSLAAEVLAHVFRPRRVKFAVLDSTHPSQIAEAARSFPAGRSLYIVSSKSGDTAEVMALFEYFWMLAKGDGSRFIAITDPGTLLDALANARGFRRTFLADPDVGGRYSALSQFGLVPAALMGINIQRMLTRAAWMADQCHPEVTGARNPGLVLGAALSQAALAGRDKMTILADPPLAAFGSWLEQLIAESSGKHGKGIIVVDGEPPGSPQAYASDRLFVYLRKNGALDAEVTRLKESGHPVLIFSMLEPYSLGAEFYRWEFAAAVACAELGINAFDQPDVQDSKDRTRIKIAEYHKSGRLAGNDAVGLDDSQEVLSAWLARSQPGNYIAINAYLPRDSQTCKDLGRLRMVIREKTGCATMLGFGPRFLHSTGQLHKGGPDSGLFLQITADTEEDMLIPVQGKNPKTGMSFATLQRAQAMGDYEALVARGRRILHLHLKTKGDLKLLVNALKKWTG